MLPDQFPIKYHGIVGMGEGEWLLTSGEERKDLEKIARHFRAFMRAIRMTKDHPLKPLAEAYTIRTRITTLDVWRCLFLLHIIIRPRLILPSPGK